MSRLSYTHQKPDPDPDVVIPAGYRRAVYGDAEEAMTHGVCRHGYLVRMDEDTGHRCVWTLLVLEETKDE